MNVLHWIIFGFACMFLAGIADGINQASLFHTSDFLNKFPYATAQYWDHLNLAWMNKYKPGTLEPRFFGSTTFLAWTQDGYHLTREICFWLQAFGWFFLGCTGPVIVLSSTRFWLALFPIAYIIRAIGFHIIYTFWL